MTRFSFSWSLNGIPDVQIQPYENALISPAEARAFKDLGFDACRLDDSAVIAYPEEGDYQFWRATKPNVSTLIHAGIEPNVNTIWCPWTMAQGLNTFYPYTGGSSVRIKENYVNGQLIPGRQPFKFADHRPWVAHPPKMTGWFEYGAALATAISKWVRTYIWFNEPGGNTYWPAINDQAHIAEAVTEWCAQAAQYFRGILSVQPDARFAVCEADGEDILGRIINEFKKPIYADIRPRIFAYTHHPYSWGTFPEDSYKRYNAFERVLDAVGDPDVERWANEITDEGTGRMPEWLRVVLAFARPPDLINIAMRGDLVQPTEKEKRCGTCHQPWQAAREYAPTPLGLEVAAVIAEHKAELRRRAVKS
jgi:hypothetical protein